MGLSFPIRAALGFCGLIQPQISGVSYLLSVFPLFGYGLFTSLLHSTRHSCYNLHQEVDKPNDSLSKRSIIWSGFGSTIRVKSEI